MYVNGVMGISEMIDNNTISRIYELLQCKKMSQRQIAKQLNVSRGTVQSVANGKRKAKNADANGKIPFSWGIPSGKPQRCRRCGTLAKLPCLACQLYEKELLALVVAYTVAGMGGSLRPQ